MCKSAIRANGFYLDCMLTNNIKIEVDAAAVLAKVNLLNTISHSQSNQIYFLAQFKVH